MKEGAGRQLLAGAGHPGKWATVLGTLGSAPPWEVGQGTSVDMTKGKTMVVLVKGTLANEVCFGDADKEPHKDTLANDVCFAEAGKVPLTRNPPQVQS